MKSNKAIFEVGQKINTIKYTDYKDIVKVRIVTDARGDEVQFGGLQGWWVYRDSTHNPNTDGRKYFSKRYSYSSHQLIVIE